MTCLKVCRRGSAWMGKEVKHHPGERAENSRRDPFSIRRAGPCRKRTDASRPVSPFQSGPDLYLATLATGERGWDIQSSIQGPNGGPGTPAGGSEQNALKLQQV